MDERLQELCDDYVLGLLEGEELAEMLRLLGRARTSESVGVEAAMRNSQEMVALLAWGAPSVSPRAGLRRRVLRMGRRVSEPLPFPLVLKSADFDDEQEQGPARGSSGWGAVAWLGWAAAAGLGGAAILLNGRADTVARDLAGVKQQVALLRVQVADRDRVLTVIGARDSRSIRLVTISPEGPQFRAYWSDSAGLVLTGTGVAAPRTGRTLQLWIVPKQGMPISAGVFAPGARGEVLLVATNMPAPDVAKALAISDEPMGGSAQPTTTPAWVGAL